MQVNQQQVKGKWKHTHSKSKVRKYVKMQRKKNKRGCAVRKPKKEQHKNILFLSLISRYADVVHGFQTALKKKDYEWQRINVKILLERLTKAVSRLHFLRSWASFLYKYCTAFIWWIFFQTARISHKKACINIPRSRYWFVIKDEMTVGGDYCYLRCFSMLWLWQRIFNMFLALKQVHISSNVWNRPLLSSPAAPSIVFPCVIDYRMHRAVIRRSNPVSATINYSSHSTYPYEVNHCENYCSICWGALNQGYTKI